MKFVFITDIHAYAFNDFSRNIQCSWDDELDRYIECETGELVLNSRLFNILSALADTRDYCFDNRIHLVVNGGDTFHKRSILDVVTFNCVYKVLESYQKYDIRQLILSGNHDNAINSDKSPSSIESFKNFAEIVTEPTVTEYYDETNNEDVKFCCIPWMKTKEKSIDFINGKLNKNSILVAHLGIAGASLGSGYVMSDDYNLSELKVDKWKYCLFGHYHHPQVLYENSIYGGSPLSNDFGDYGEHGFWVIDTSKRWDMEMIPLKFPQFLTLTPETMKDYSKEELEYNYIRVKASAKDVDKVQKDLEDAGEVRIEVEKEYVKNARSDISVTMKKEDILETYVKENEENEDRQQSLILKGIEVLRKVSGIE